MNFIGKISVSQAKKIENVAGNSISYTCHDNLHSDRVEYGNFFA